MTVGRANVNIVDERGEWHCEECDASSAKSLTKHAAKLDGRAHAVTSHHLVIVEILTRIRYRPEHRLRPTQIPHAGAE